VRKFSLDELLSIWDISDEEIHLYASLAALLPNLEELEINVIKLMIINHNVINNDDVGRVELENFRPFAALFKKLNSYSTPN
jgi:hypothetical protein